MKRIIALVLSLVMILSLATVFVSAAPSADSVGKVASGYAPEGTGIDAWDKVTAADGKYYLTKDITVETTSTTVFTGTIDGNGHTITVKVPMFAEFAGTFKNAVIAGSIDVTGAATSTHTGTIGNTATGTVVIENVKNTATVKGWVLDDKAGDKGTITGRIATGGLLGYCKADVTVKNCANTAAINGYAVGGLVGMVDTDTSKVAFEGCTNSGKITDEGAVKSASGNNGALGGMIGIANAVKTTSFIDCHNTADVIGTNGGTEASNCPVGGLVGYIWVGSAIIDAYTTMKDCSNTGNIKGSNQVGGLGGAMYAIVNGENLVNKGNVESTNNYAGGIFSRSGHDQPSTKDNATSYANLKNVENHGDVKSATQYGAGVIGYASYGVVIENAVNYGDVDATTSESAGDAGGIVGRVVYTTTIKNSYNYGKIMTSTSHGCSAGGIAGRASHSGGVNLIENCGNYGEIVGGGKGINYGAGGVLGYVWGGSKGSTTIRYCFNAGKVSATNTDNSVAGIVPYFNASETNIQYCFNVGELVLAEGSTGRKVELWYNKHDSGTSEEYTHHNYYIAGEGKAAIVYGANGDKSAEAITVSADDVKSGKLCYDLNTAIGSVVFKQTLGTDAAPTTLATSKVVEKTATGYANPVAPVTPPTGDATVVIVLALVAVSAGAVLTLKKRQSVR